MWFLCLFVMPQDVFVCECVHCIKYGSIQLVKEHGKCDTLQNECTHRKIPFSSLFVYFKNEFVKSNRVVSQIKVTVFYLVLIQHTNMWPISQLGFTLRSIVPMMQ